MTTPVDPQLPATTAIAEIVSTTDDRWFCYPVTAYPHHTDYSGVLWHGAYIAWMEEARVKCLQQVGVSFADLVQLGCDLPVVELAIRYHLPIRMGQHVIVKTRMVDVAGVRINWDYRIESPDAQELYVTARVTLVAIDADKRKIMRQLPPDLTQALLKLGES